MGKVIDLVARMKRVYERYGRDLPRFKIYHKSGMYHFILDCAASDYVEQQIAEVTAPIFRNIDQRDTDPKMVRWLGAEIERGIKEIKKKGMWFDEDREIWLGEHERRVHEDRSTWDFSPLGTFENMKRFYQSRYGRKEGAFLATRISKIHRKNPDPCKDNERFALEGKMGDMRRYEAQRDEGCCGFSDTRLEFIDYDTGKKKVFWYGFNYGH